MIVFNLCSVRKQTLARLRIEPHARHLTHTTHLTLMMDTLAMLPPLLHLLLLKWGAVLVAKVVGDAIRVEMPKSLGRGGAPRQGEP